MKISFVSAMKAAKRSNHAAIVTVSDNKKLGAAASKLDTASGKLVSKALKAGKFGGKKGETLSIVAPSKVGADYIIVLGLGKEKDITALSLAEAGGSLVPALNALGMKSAELHAEAKAKGVTIAAAAANIANGALLRSYRFHKYYTKKKPDELPSFATLNVVLKEAAAAKKTFAELEAITQGVFFARDLVTEPSNYKYPEALAKQMAEISSLGVKVEVLGLSQLKKLGMGALIGVGQGSVHEPKVVVMQWNGDKKGTKPVAFIGKGVTFDTGGISIKPSQGMEEMKYDMHGSATVAGLMKALAGRKAKANVVGVVGLAENMPDGNAQRPGDVVKSMSGQTIEVLNTDAEGRLVLGDVLWYTQDRFKPQFMINLATLTGAIVISLGNVRAGLFSNNDALSAKIEKAADKTGELVWRFPLGDAYDAMINSDIADMRNIGDGRGAGSITAAQFLQRFVNNVPWAHLDIAGMAWAKSDLPLIPKGAAGYGVRMLDQLVKDNYEK